MKHVVRLKLRDMQLDQENHEAFLILSAHLRCSCLSHKERKNMIFKKIDIQQYQSSVTDFMQSLYLFVSIDSFKA